MNGHFAILRRSLSWRALDHFSRKELGGMRQLLRKGTAGEEPVNQCRAAEGLTLVELLLALLLTGLILAAVYNLFGSQENTQVLVDQLSEMNQNLRIAANAILMDMRQAGFHVENGVASSGIGQLRAIVVQDGGPGNPDTLTVLYAVPGFETTLSEDYLTPGAPVPIEDGCPLCLDSLASCRTCEQPSPQCFCSGDVIIITGGGSSSVFEVTSNAVNDETSLDVGPSSAYNNPSGHQGSGFTGYRKEAPVFKAVRRTYRVDRTTNPPTLRVTEGAGAEQTLVEGIEDLQITPTGANNRFYEVAITARTRKAIPGSGYRRRTITETVTVRNPL